MLLHIGSFFHLETLKLYGIRERKLWRRALSLCGANETQTAIVSFSSLVMDVMFHCSDIVI